MRARGTAGSNARCHDNTRSVKRRRLEVASPLQRAGACRSAAQDVGATARAPASRSLWFTQDLLGQSSTSSQEPPPPGRSPCWCGEHSSPSLFNPQNGGDIEYTNTLKTDTKLMSSNLR